MSTNVEPLPWIVAEALGLKLLRIRPESVAIAGDAAGRLRRCVGGLGTQPMVDWELHKGATLEQTVEALVWVGDEPRGTPLARRQILELSARCSGVVLLAEPAVAGEGIGKGILRAMDPDLLTFHTDELPDGLGGTRTRHPWEAPRQWCVAGVSAWRFTDGAELAREGFVARLRSHGGPALLLAARRVLQYFPTAHEVFVLAASELARRGDQSSLSALMVELDLSGGAPSSVLRALRAVVGVDLQTAHVGGEVAATTPLADNKTA